MSKYLLSLFLNFVVTIEILEFEIQKKYKKDTSVSEDLTMNNFIYGFDLSLGTPPQKIRNVMIDTGSFVSWVKDTSYDSKKSSTSQNTGETKTIQYGIGQTSGPIYKDKLRISGKDLDFVFINAQNSQLSSQSGLIGLGRDFAEVNEESFSILSRLKNAKIIEKKIFSQKYITKEKGKLIIGDYPEEVKKNPNNYTAMRVNEEDYKINYFWTGYLSHILIGDTYDFKLAEKFGKWVVFDTGSNNCYFPVESKEIFDKIFKNSLEANDCQVNFDIFTQIYTYSCSSEHMEENPFPIVNLIFNGWAYRFDTNDLFEDIGFGQKQFKIMFQIGNSNYIIGEPILTKYLFVFDGEKNQIGIFGDFRYNFTMFTSDPPINHFTTLTLLVIIICILGFIILIVLIWFCVKTRKRVSIENNTSTRYENLNR